MNCKADVDYNVIYGPGERANRDVIRRLTCRYCERFAAVRRPAKRGEKSGIGVYNRMRAGMVRHIHADHADVVAARRNKPS